MPRAGRDFGARHGVRSGIMSAPERSDSKVDPAVAAGFAVGVGITFVATLGVFWRYWQPGASPVVWVGATFALGALIGLAWAVGRKVRL